MKKFVSLLLSLALTATLFIPVSAYAEDKTVNVYFTGYESNYETLIAINQLNTERAKNGFNAFAIDDKLTTIARQRAKELFVSYEQYLPTDQTMTAYIADYDDDKYMDIYDKFTSTAPTSDEIYSKISELAKLKNNVKSIGLGVFTVDDITVVYVIVSTNVPTAPCKNFADGKVNATVSTLESNISYSISIKYDDKYFCMIPDVLFNAKYGLLKDYVVTDQFAISSSNSKICKAKGNILYPKACGSYNITAVNKLDSNIKVVLTDSIPYIDNVTVKKLSVKSDKKNRISVSWKHSNVDADGYEIQYSTNKNFAKGKNTKSVTVKDTKKLSKNIKSLKSNKVYYVRVRGYVDQGNGEKIYGKYCKAVKVKIK